MQKDFSTSRASHDPNTVPAEIKEVLDFFLAALPERISEIRSTLQNGDWDKLKKLVHKLKGASGTCGYMDLMTKLEEIENNLFNECDSQYISEELEKLPSLTRWDSSLLI